MKRRLATGVTKSGNRASGNSDDYWFRPPSPYGSHVNVTLTFVLQTLTAINTIENSAFVRVAVVWQWTDDRLRGRHVDVVLPNSLWGPYFDTTNALELEVRHNNFRLEDPNATGYSVNGACKRVAICEGTVRTSFELSHFPFDTQRIYLNFVSGSHWMSYDRETNGAMPLGQSYKLIPSNNFVITQQDGQVLRHAVHEWIFHGISYKLEELPPQPFVDTYAFLNLHISRNLGYYWVRVFFPQWILAIATLFAFALEESSDKLTYMSAVLLAGFTTLFTLETAIPKLGFITLPDAIIFSTFCFIIGMMSQLIRAPRPLSACASRLYSACNFAKQKKETGDEAISRRSSILVRPESSICGWLHDHAVVLTLIAIYMFINIAFLVGPLTEFRSQQADLDTPDGGKVIQRNSKYMMLEQENLETKKFISGDWQLSFLLGAIAIFLAVVVLFGFSPSSPALPFPKEKSVIEASSDWAFVGSSPHSFVQASSQESIGIGFEIVEHSHRDGVALPYASDCANLERIVNDHQKQEENVVDGQNLDWI